MFHFTLRMLQDQIALKDKIKSIELYVFIVVYKITFNEKVRKQLITKHNTHI